MIGLELAKNDFGEYLRPHFASCIDEIDRVDRNDALYDEMLRQPLAPQRSDGKLLGLWDPEPLGKILRDILVAFGYVT